MLTQYTASHNIEEVYPFSSSSSEVSSVYHTDHNINQVLMMVLRFDDLTKHWN